MRRIRRSRISRRRRREKQVLKTCDARKIPLGLLIEILARLPAKSVMRFKCISKSWSSLFSSRYFCDRFLIVRSQPQPQPRFYMSLFDLCNITKSVILSSSAKSILLPSTSPSSLVFDQDLTIRGIGGYELSVLRGFMCFTVEYSARIYNPSTRQLVNLPDISESDILAHISEYDMLPSIVNFIAHDPVTDQYKLLCIITAMAETSDDNMLSIRPEHWVFVLEAGGSWKRKMLGIDLHPYYPQHIQVNMNGVLYHLGWTENKSYVLVRFDVRSEEFDMIQVPRNARYPLPTHKKRLITPIDYGGKVAVFELGYIKKTGTVDLWVVEDWRKNQWSNKTMVLKPDHMQVVMETTTLAPIGTPLKDKIIFYPLKLVSPFYFLCYDMQNNDLKKVEIKEGISNRWFNRPEETKYFDLNFMDPSESVKYLEI